MRSNKDGKYSVAIFGYIKSLGNFMQVYLVSGQIVNLLWQIFNAIGQIFMVVAKC